MGGNVGASACAHHDVLVISNRAKSAFTDQIRRLRLLLNLMLYGVQAHWHLHSVLKHP